MHKFVRREAAEMKDNLKLKNHHKNYSIYLDEGMWTSYYSSGNVESVHMIPGELNKKTYEFISRI